MAQELTDAQRERIVFAGKIYAAIYQGLGQVPCTTFLCSEDDYETKFHACVCNPGAITILRLLPRGEDEDDDE